LFYTKELEDEVYLKSGVNEAKRLSDKAALTATARPSKGRLTPITMEAHLIGVHCKKRY